MSFVLLDFFYGDIEDFFFKGNIPLFSRWCRDRQWKLFAWQGRESHFSDGGFDVVWILKSSFFVFEI